MAPKLAQSQHSLISDMLRSKSLKAHEIVGVAEYSIRSVYAIKSNIRRYGSTKALSNVGGRPRSITPAMFEALRERLLEKPGLCQDEMVLFLLDEFKTQVSSFSIGRALRSIGWTKKKIRRVGKGRNANLRDLYMYNTKDFYPEHFIFSLMNQVAINGGFRRTGWFPLGVTPVQVAQFQREQRYQILPAYTQDGVILARVFRGSAVFEEFIEQLRPLCGRWPVPKSVLVMDNASFHYTERIE